MKAGRGNAGAGFFFFFRGKKRGSKCKIVFSHSFNCFITS